MHCDRTSEKGGRDSKLGFDNEPHNEGVGEHLQHKPDAQRAHRLLIRNNEVLYDEAILRLDEDGKTAAYSAYVRILTASQTPKEPIRQY